LTVRASRQPSASRSSNIHLYYEQTLDGDSFERAIAPLERVVRTLHDHAHPSHQLIVSEIGFPEAGTGLAAAAQTHAELMSRLLDNGTLGLWLAEHGYEVHLGIDANAEGERRQRLLINDGQGRFSDQTEDDGSGQPRLPPTAMRGYGCQMLDVEEDGDLDVVVVNDVSVVFSAARRPWR
jgi:hypothetical protein